MQQNLSIARRFLPLVEPSSFADPRQSEQLCIGREGEIEVIYAPFDHVERGARLVIVGITPGLVQAVNALRAAHEARHLGLEAQLAHAKLAASFSGPMRANLVAMLDRIGVADHFGLGSTGELFAPATARVHFTSALRYPIFVNGKNYNGTPDMLATPMLRAMVETHLLEEARLLPDALWLPLGPQATKALTHLTARGELDPGRVLSGLPHPSGANAERVAVFLGRKPAHLASRQTRPGPLLEAAARLTAQVAHLGRGAA